MIRIEKVNKRFGKLQALHDVSLHFRAGECIALIGPNGCGKTTLIKSVLGMVLPDSGNILFRDRDIREDYRYRSEIGYMPQIGRYPDNMDIGQVIRTILELRGSTLPPDDELYRAWNLDALSSKRMSSLSGGTRQKVSAVLACMFDPPVLILDEPTAGLDPLASEIFKEKIMKEKAKGKLILITSHLLSELDGIVSEVVCMQDGEVRFHQAADTLKKETGESSLSKAISGILRRQSAWEG